MNKKCILITGSSGFIGRNLKEALEDTYTVFSPLHDELDLLDKSSVQKFFIENKVDVVIHTANRNNTKHQVSEYDVIQSNLKMFYNLEQQQEQYDRLIYFGSGAEYGKHRALDFVCEGDFGAVIPEDAYGLSKYVMAKEAERSEKIYDICIFGVYGKYEEYNRRFISNAICRALKGMPVTLSQNALFSYIYIDDLVEITKWFIENKPREHRYNVMPDEAYWLLDLAQMVREEFDNAPKLELGSDGLKLAYAGSSKRLIQEIGSFSFTHPKEAIKNLRQYYENISIGDLL